MFIEIGITKMNEIYHLVYGKHDFNKDLVLHDIDYLQKRIGKMQW
jgi:hypothetical protein